METQAPYETTPAEPPHNGATAPPAASTPTAASEEWCELEEVVVQLKFAWKRRSGKGTVTVRPVPFNPTRLLANPANWDSPYGSALEAMIEQGQSQAQGQQ